MKLPAAARPMLPLAIGLALGAAGVSMFRASLTGPAGSPEERAATLEVELKKANNRIAALEDTDASGRRKSLRTTRDNLREIRDRLQSGQEVTPEDIFRLTQPFMRDIAPLLERMREREQQQTADRLSGEFAREFNLDAGQQDALRQWFEAKAADNAQEWTRLVSQDGTRLQDLMKAARDVRADDGLDEFMPRILTGEKLAEFQTQRMEERVGRVQNEADAKTERLHSIVPLDDTQRDQVFGIMARNSRDYMPSMQLEGGVSEIAPGQTGDREQAILSVLRPDQRVAYQQEMQRRREAVASEYKAIGLALPADWNPAEMEDF
jgi:predicted  nucleic acid-binding Zn-ribbon protein